MHILLVDPNNTNRQNLASFLRRKRHHVVEGSSGSNALEFLRKQNGSARVDLLITENDIGNPGGVELVTEIQKKFSGARLCMVSDSTEEDWRENAKKAGVQHIFGKHFDTKQFCKTLGI